MEKSIVELRLEAAWCWDFSSKVYPFSGSMLKEIMGKIENFMGLDNQESLPTFEQVAQKCDELVLVDDASVRVMTLTAMFLMHYISPKIDIIASWLDSKEEGYSYDWRSGNKFDKPEALGEKTRQYLIWVLNIRDTQMFYKLGEIIEHWGGILGYGNPFGIETEEKWERERQNHLKEANEALDELQKYWEEEMAQKDFCETLPDPFYREENLWAPSLPLQDLDREEHFVKEIDGIPKLVKRYLNGEEYRIKQEESKRDSWRHFRQDISSYVYRCMETSFIEDKRREMRKALEKISRYAFCREKDMLKVAHVIDLFNHLIVWEHIPPRWLLEISQDIYKSK